MLSNNRIFLLLYFIFLPLAFYFYGHHLDSADIIQYFSLSEKYQRLSFYEAASAFWSPLLSWLLIPFRLIVDDNLLSFKILQSLVILGAYLQLISLSARLTGNFILRFYFLLFSLLVLFDYGFLCASPDLLYLFFLLCLLNLALKKEWKTMTALHFGALGALLYFSKSFGFVFFIALLFSLLLFRKKFAHIPARLLPVCAGVFLLLCAPWIAVISNKSGRLLFSGASEYNFRILSPQVNPNVFAEIKHPISEPHLQRPAGQYAVSAWEDPLSMPVPGASFSPAHHAKLAVRNVFSLAFYYFKLNHGSLLLLLLLLVLFVARSAPAEVMRAAFAPLLFCAITTSLYCFILTQQRYLIINEIMILLLIAMLLERVQAPVRKKSAAACFVISGVFAFFTFKKDFSSGFCTDWKKDEIVQRMSKEVKFIHAVSDKQDGDEGYALNTILCSFSGMKNYGMISLEDFDQYRNGVNKMDIKYLVVKGHNTIKREHYPFCTFLTYSPALGYSLYELKPER